MHSQAAPSSRTPRTNGFQFGLLLFAAFIGFMVVVYGTLAGEPQWLGTGTIVFGMALLAYLFAQFRLARAAPSAVPEAVEVVPRRGVALAQADPPSLEPVRRGNSFSQTLRTAEDPVSFEVEGFAPEVPLRLELPDAFDPEARPEMIEDEEAWRAQERAKPAHTKRARRSAVERRKEWVGGLPLVSSILSEETPAPAPRVPTKPGKTRGQCSGCQTFLWAPTTRPIRLRCPKCGRVSTLTS